MINRIKRALNSILNPTPQENLEKKTQELNPQTKRPTRKRLGRGFIGGFN